MPDFRPEPPAGTPAHEAWLRERARGDEARSRAEQQRQAVLAARVPAPDAERGEWASLNSVAGRPTDVASAYGALIAVALERAQGYSEMIARQLAAAGDDEAARFDVLVKTQRVYDADTDALVDNGEQPSALVRMEAAERAAAAKLIVEGARMQLDEAARAAVERQQRIMASAARRLAEAAGLDWSLPESRRVAQAALLAARDEVERADAGA